MKAMILAAGLGTRLRPITDSLPKALVPVCGKPMIEWAIDRLRQAGVNQIVVNVHYLADKLQDYLQTNNFSEVKFFFSDERSELLDTGGALLKASFFFDDEEPFIVYNTDVISDLDLTGLISFHRHSGNLATLAVRHRPTSRNLIVDENNQLIGWCDSNSGEEKWVYQKNCNADKLAYSGIQIINPQIFSFITEKGAFPLIPLYLRLAREHSIGVYCHDHSYWYDLGSMKNLQKAEEELRLQQRK